MRMDGSAISRISHLNLVRLSPVLVAWVFLAGSPVHAETAAEVQTVKILTVGNSFANDATAFLPQIAEAAGKKVVLLRANIGGCSLEKHCGLMEAAERGEKAGRAYQGTIWGGTDPKTPFSLKEALVSDDWDIVTIQQFSNTSYLPETYEPYAGKLIAFIREYAPRADVRIHQTWAYREDYPGFGKDGFDQSKMYAGLESAYGELARRYKMDIIPVGKAFQLARAQPLWHFEYPDTAYDYENPKVGDVPKQPGSLNVGWQWTVDRATGEKVRVLDYKHANVAGKYLGAAVFFESLFGMSVVGNSFQPKGLSAEQMESLQHAAHEAVATVGGNHASKARSQELMATQLK